MVSEFDNSLKGHELKPKLRLIEILPAKIKEENVICLRDPDHIALDTIFLPEEALPLLALLNGQNSLGDIKRILVKQTGEDIPLEAIEDFLQSLDERFFLDSPAFEAHYRGLKSEFEARTIRPAALAGIAYPENPDELADSLNRYTAGLNLPEQELKNYHKETPLAAIVPHVDFDRGGPVYAQAYSRLDPDNPPDLVVILGTAHSSTKGFLCLCDKDFETPFGLLPRHKELTEKLIKQVGKEILADEFTHKTEHSVEFQAVWLKKIFGRAKNMSILPFLCGSFFDLIETGQNPLELEAYIGPVKALKSLLGSFREEGNKLLVLASVDLSHVGPQFGDDAEITLEISNTINDYDHLILDAAAKGDFEDFYGLVALSKDQTHVCGLSSIYTMLYLLDRPVGRLLSYDQWIDENRLGLVSFAGMLFP